MCDNVRLKEYLQKKKSLLALDLYFSFFLRDMLFILFLFLSVLLCCALNLSFCNWFSRITLL